MIEAKQAGEIEERLAAMLEVSVDDLRDYLRGNLRAGPARRTGIKFVRGTHSGRYVRHPEGTDMLPAGYEEPPYQEPNPPSHGKLRQRPSPRLGISPPS